MYGDPAYHPVHAPASYGWDPHGGSLGPAIAAQLPHVEWAGAQGEATGLPDAAPSMPPEPLAWRLVKHAALVAFAVMAVLVAVAGSGDPLMVGGYGATALLCIVVFMVADRMRFAEHGTTGAAYDVASDFPIGDAFAIAPEQYAVTGYAPQLPAMPPAPAHAPSAFHVTVT